MSITVKIDQLLSRDQQDEIDRWRFQREDQKTRLSGGIVPDETHHFETFEDFLEMREKKN